MIELTSSPLIPAEIISKATDPMAGGINVFIGTIRNFHSGKAKKVLHLLYEAYEPMAELEIRNIAEQATAKFGIVKWAISHRTGVLLPGEVAVVVAVSTKHRKESFQACEYIIDQLKATVPIWKKEVFEDGEEWVSAHP